MSDRFFQEIQIELKAPLNVWKVAAEAEAMMEAGWGHLWKDLWLERSARTTTNITFYGESLLDLHAKTDQHGAALSSVAVWSTLMRDGVHATECRVFMSPRPSDGELSSIKFEVVGPNRVDVEAFTHSLRRSTEILQKKKAWNGVTFKLGAFRMTSVADGTTSKMTPIIRARGVRSTLWRQFVMRRNEVAFGLTVGLAGSLIFNGLQLAGIVAVPR